MTTLEAMLERAAEAQPVTFDAGDVRRRVQKRRRVRRAASVVTVVAVLGGVLGLASLNGSNRSDHLAGSVRPASLVGRWVPVSANGLSPDDRYRAALERIDGQIARQQHIVEQAKGAERAKAMNVLTTLETEREVLQSQPPTHVEFRADGTLGGVDDMCGDLAGHWRLDGDRLLVDLSKGDVCIQPASQTPLSHVLRGDPTVRAGAEPGTLELTSPEGSVTLRSAVGPDAIIDTEVVGHVKTGGVVKATFHTRRSVDDGRSVVATWDLASSAKDTVTVWVAVALTDAGAACHADGIVLPAGPWKPVVLTPGHPTDAGTAPADIPAECASDATLVLRLDSDAFVEHDVTARVPITIR